MVKKQNPPQKPQTKSKTKKRAGLGARPQRGVGQSPTVLILKLRRKK